MKKGFGTVNDDFWLSDCLSKRKRDFAVPGHAGDQVARTSMIRISPCRLITILMTTYHFSPME